MIIRLLSVVCLAFLSSCSSADDDRFFANYLGQSKEEVIKKFGKPKNEEGRTGGFESLIWEGRSLSVHSTFNDGKAVRFAYVISGHESVDKAAVRIRDSYSNSLGWRKETRKIFEHMQEVLVRADSKVFIMEEKKVVYVFGEEFW